MYAWGCLPPKRKSSIAGEKNLDFQSCIVEVFIEELKKLAKKGLLKEYKPVSEKTPMIKGQIQWSESIIPLKTKNQLHCLYDEYSCDIKINRLIKTTCINLIKTSNIRREQRERIKSYLYIFSGVQHLPINGHDFKIISLTPTFKRNYGFIYNLCHLIHKGIMPQEKNGEFQFIDFLKDERKMRDLFEKFIRGFCKHHIEDKKEKVYVKSESLSWKLQLVESGGNKQNFLPRMKTDTSIIWKNNKIIIETKYTDKMLTTSRFDEDIKKFQSDHLYQLHSYISQSEEDHITGILMYPSLGKKVRSHYKSLKGFEFHVVTIDLSQHWQAIEEEIFDVIHADKKVS